MYMFCLFFHCCRRSNPRKRIALGNFNLDDPVNLPSRRASLPSSKSTPAAGAVLCVSSHLCPHHAVPHLVGKLTLRRACVQHSTLVALCYLIGSLIDAVPSDARTRTNQRPRQYTAFSLRVG
ncbi:hypothetical protein P171DRAFT_244178 [Karstenula rhodostoma CBS 690.94]|uniref:Uncharacterized protein n=1 Tax=Karstenula rhodostoma CBS 690.94 TaxID=1392251 RepID=A0A9P4PMQ7_9PLEO|nr:hypothetical protein P171DRAFT_244178 [Karstenula rhodostoma CBS 690.94]